MPKAVVRYIVADCVIDLGVVYVDADGGLDSAFPNHVVDPKQVQISAQFRQRDGVANTRD